MFSLPDQLEGHWISEGRTVVVSNDPSWWPQINLNIISSYWMFAACVVVVYDWVLTLGQEIELIWRQRWSLMTVLYLIVHTLYWNTVFCCYSSGIYAIGIADRCSTITYSALCWTNEVVTGMVGVIMVARLHAMYQGSRKMLIFLVIMFLVVNIACGVILVIILKHTVGEELILSGTYVCNYGMSGDEQLLYSMIWMLNTVWEVLALCLSVWIAVKHFRNLRRLGRSTGSTIGDCFRVLIQFHVLYFASFFFSLLFVYISPETSNLNVSILSGDVPVLLVVQLFVLGPRLILSVREYHAKLTADSNTETSRSSIAFQERVHVSTSSTV
ncbi:uncharacterized protein HD556DRAFT_1531148 [Suillus plorans]|uniref:DUF6533 domain-containing protein n=1 Tax=Suillus plorans TaxID=116603 RepID=A0A9P7ADR1_9AGAM|nr:uncharacterized protein HD556DRAFT_1531148 [Suillus plorans]KAG1786227.1 hypothetical protein HD556DRAFT_1531148 [Suillus plorans]